MNSKIELGRYLFAVERAGGIYAFGRVERVVGLTVEVTGLSARIGDLCWIYPSEDSRPVEAEVVGFRNDVLLLMPLAELQGVHSAASSRLRGPSCPFRSVKASSVERWMDSGVRSTAWPSRRRDPIPDVCGGAGTSQTEAHRRHDSYRRARD